MPDSPKNTPEPPHNRFFLTDKPNPFAERAKRRHMKVFLIIFFGVLGCIGLAYASITLASGDGPKWTVDE